MLQKAELSRALETLYPVTFSQVQFYMIDKYVDDVFTATSIIKKGYKWNFSTGALQWDPDTASATGDSTEDDARTLEEISKVSSSIFQCLNFTWDTPSKNNSKMMPVLDVQLWVGTESREASINQNMAPNPSKKLRMGSLKDVILFKFYKKPMASKTNNRYKGGIAEGSKIATGVQETLRRLKNTSRDLPDHVCEEILLEYMQELRESGYPLSVREEIINSAITGYCRIWELECLGTGHVNRPSQATALKRRATKLSPHGWFTKTRNNSTKPDVQRPAKPSKQGQNAQKNKKHFGAAIIPIPM